jgi:hypothetical protein
MKHEVKQKWCAALRSGEYRQGKGRLKRKERGVEEFCCLGVLCDIYSKETGTPWLGQHMHQSWLYPHYKVREWAVVEEIKCDSLACMNDAGKSFEEIADYIETSL